MTIQILSNRLEEVAMIMESTDTLSEALEAYRRLKGGL